MTRRIKDTVCPEGKKMTKTGARCIEDKDYKWPPLRRTVCLEGYKISRDGKCIKDKNYKITVTRKTPKKSSTKKSSPKKSSPKKWGTA